MVMTQQRNDVREQVDDRMPMPTPRGPMSAELIAAWTRRSPTAVSPGQIAHARAWARSLSPEAVVGDDDLQLALYACYELHYTGVRGVDDRWEWESSLLAFRTVLEDAFEAGLRRIVPAPDPKPARIERALAVITGRPGGALSTFLEHDAEPRHAEEFLMHRSAYNLKEADPHTWVIPRLRGDAKAALVEIQADEYGGGNPAWVHATLFAASMRAAGLDDSPGAYVDTLPGTTLATVNLMSLFGLHRRLRGAAMGHLAAFEMTSCTPNRRYGNGLRRLGASADATAYFDEHVEADAVHGAVAARDVAGALVRDDPTLDREVRFGAEALLALEDRAGRWLLDAWRRGVSSLIAPGSTRAAS
jgi:hypothetical protein